MAKPPGGDGVWRTRADPGRCDSTGRVCLALEAVPCGSTAQNYSERSGERACIRSVVERRHSLIHSPRNDVPTLNDAGCAWPRYINLLLPWEWQLSCSMMWDLDNTSNLLLRCRVLAPARVAPAQRSRIIPLMTTGAIVCH